MWEAKKRKKEIMLHIIFFFNFRNVSVTLNWGMAKDSKSKKEKKVQVARRKNRGGKKGKEKL